MSSFRRDWVTNGLLKAADATEIYLGIKATVALTELDHFSTAFQPVFHALLGRIHLLSLLYTLLLVPWRSPTAFNPALLRLPYPRPRPVLCRDGYTSKHVKLDKYDILLWLSGFR